MSAVLEESTIRARALTHVNVDSVFAAAGQLTQTQSA